MLRTIRTHVERGRIEGRERDLGHHVRSARGDGVPYDPLGKCTHPCEVGLATGASLHARTRFEHCGQVLVGDAAQHRVGKSRGMRRDGPHQLDALAHRDGRGRREVEHLEGGDAQTVANARLKMARATQVRIDHTVELALCGDGPHDETSGQRTVPLVEGVHAR